MKNATITILLNFTLVFCFNVCFGQNTAQYSVGKNIYFANIKQVEDTLQLNFNVSIASHSYLTICDDFGREKFRSCLANCGSELKLPIRNYCEGTYQVVLHQDIAEIGRQTFTVKR